MLGYEIFITPVSDKKPFELVFMVGWAGLRWIWYQEKQGVFENIGDAHGYPFRFHLTWSQVIEWLGSRHAGDNGTVVLCDDEDIVFSSDAQSRIILDVNAFNMDEIMLVEAWDQS